MKGDSFEKRRVVLIVTQKRKKGKKPKEEKYLLLQEEVISVIIDGLYDKKDNNVVLVQNKPMEEFHSLLPAIHRKFHPSSSNIIKISLKKDTLNK